MRRLEEELKDILRREDAPSGFGWRVMSRIQREGENRRARRRFAPAWVVACLLVSVVLPFAGVEYRREQQRKEGQVAKQQVVLALQIASSKLNYAHRKVREISDGGETR